jgi:TonB family protein
VEHVDRIAECATKNPALAPGTAWHGEIRADYEVDEHGAVQGLRLDDFGDGAPEAVLRAIVDWLMHCKFQPPTQAKAHVTQFFDVGTHGPALIAADMTRPVPVDCPTPKPRTPEEARGSGITGIVLVSYVVQTDGRVTRVHLRNPSAPRVLFLAVRDWLLSCRFTPSMHDGKPLAVKVIQPFNFTIR